MSDESISFVIKGKKLGFTWFNVYRLNTVIGQLEVSDHGEFYYFYAAQRSGFVFSGRNLEEIAAKLAELNSKWKLGQTEAGEAYESQKA